MIIEFSPPAIPWPTLPSVDLSNSIDTVATFVSQIQTLVAAAIGHPVLAVVALLFGIGLIQLVGDLVKRVLKALITFLLTLPLNLSQWLWKKATATAPEPKQNQINQLLARLERLHQEQEQVTAQLKGLLSSELTAQTTQETGKGKNVESQIASSQATAPQTLSVSPTTVCKSEQTPNSSETTTNINQ
ncbi:MAG: hypothetical protein AAFN12_18215 [Cyanobacteria bacterium J06560_2]